MQNALIPLSAFIALGLLWQFIQPKKIGAHTIQRPLILLIHYLLLPLLVLLTASKLDIKITYMWMSLVVMVATLGALGVAWLWLNITKYSPQTKGALMLASAFSSAVFLGMPVTSVLIGKWSMKMAFDYMLISHILVLFTVGIYLASRFVVSSKPKMIQNDLLKEPVLWAIPIGIAINQLGFRHPGWLITVETMLYACLIPLMLITVGLSLRWKQNWGNKVINMLPVAAIQLIVLPLFMYMLLKLVPSIGVKTTKALLIDGMMPAMVIGFTICDRYKFEVGAYTMAFTLTCALSLITVPIWHKLIW